MSPPSTPCWVSPTPSGWNTAAASDSAFCVPAIVNTNAWDAARNRPAALGGPTQGNPQNQAALQNYGLPPEFVGQLVADGIRNEEFFIWTHPFTLELHREALPAKARIRFSGSGRTARFPFTSEHPRGSERLGSRCTPNNQR